MYKKRISSRTSHIFTIASWVVILSAIIIFFGQLQILGSWSPTTRTRIDLIKDIFYFMAIGGLLVSVVSWVFREIRNSSLIENIIIRRFLPIIRFGINAAIWIIVITQLLESLSVDTRNILTGAGIGGAILALAAKDVMTNFLGSLSILLGRVFDIGETIRVYMKFNLAYEGIVEEITLNYTKLTKKTGEVVYIPNRTVYIEIIENVSRKRFHTYIYLVPFAKATSSTHDIQERMKIIEGKLSEYNPLEIEWEMENPNAGDFMYRIIVKFPEENNEIDREIRMYLTEHIFRG